MIFHQREFRVYIGAGQRPKQKVETAYGEEALEHALERIGKEHPDETIVVKEVLEGVIAIFLNDSETDLHQVV